MRGVRTLQGTAWIVGTENLRHQVIFVENAASALAPLNPERIQVGNAVTKRKGAAWFSARR